MAEPSYRVSRAGKTVGEFGISQVKQMLEAGVLLPTDHAWAPGMQEWQALATLFPGANPPPPPASMPPPPPASPAAVPPVFAPRPTSPDPFLALAVPIGRSGWAIAAGYLGLFSVLVLPAPFAIFCGLKAIKDIRKNPQKLGLVRAWFAIIAGTVCLLVPLLLIIIGLARG